MAVLVALHSLVRWLVLVAGALAIIRAAWGWLGTLSFARPDDLLGSLFTGLIDLNVLFGVVLLVLVWGTPNRPPLWHPLTMILAAVVAHGARMVGRRRGVRTRHLVQAIGFVVSLGLILGGIQFVV